ncbi:hypothetical protein BGZ96_006879 [Linnemannia gamsii]|uniref:Uncharacterized protein n=1 Tax=Linnemannia gamsii TaxID=64522 RepID=A0ABQ7K2A8_9FUNG|nr:hypothetical protein BGZ96_006879 [Linnemannia gamsii]
MDKISSIATVVDKLQQTFDDHIEDLKHEDTKRLDAVEEACKNAVVQAQQKTEEFVGSLSRQTEKVLQQRLDESVRDWTDTLTKQLSTSTDDVQYLVQQARTSHSTIIQDLTVNLRRAFEECLQRFEEQAEPRIIEKARAGAIAVAEEKGLELVMSMIAQTEKVVQQRLEETLQSWTETMAGQLRTAVDAVQDQFRQSPSEQRPSPQHDVDAWRTQHNSCTSSEISELKLAIVELNASTYQNQKVLQEQLRLTKNLSHQGFHELRSNNSVRLALMDYQSSLSPISVPREVQAHPPEAEATCYDSEQGATARTIHLPAVSPIVMPLTDNPSTAAVTVTSNHATDEKAYVKRAAMSKRTLVQTRGPRSTTTTAAGSGRQNTTNVGGLSARGISAIAKGKQLARQEALSYVAINPAEVEPRAQVDVQTRTAESSSTLASSSPASFSAYLQSEPELSQANSDGNRAAYVVIHGLNGSSLIPTFVKRGRGRPRKSTYNADVSLPSDHRAAISNKRMKVDLATMTSQPGKVPIKAEDIIDLTPRVTRSSRRMNHPGFVYWDLETVAQRAQEAGIRFSF